MKPFIRGEGMTDKVIKCGQILSWDVTYGGEPEPEVRWFRGDEEITQPPNDRISVETYPAGRNTVVTVRAAEREDTAKYR